MDLVEKLAILADAAKYDASCVSSGSTTKNSRNGKGIGSTGPAGICHSFTPDGRCVSLLKILLTNFCVYDCLYCINRKSSNVQRARFTVDEAVRLTLDFYKRNYIEGLFLSSGIIRNPDYTMEQVIEVARKLRKEHDFRGYIHLKTIPEASADLIREAGFYADRISINVELPTQSQLDHLAPEKNLERIEASMGAIAEQIEESKAAQNESPKAPVYAPAGQSTQMIVGAAPVTDRTILERASSLYSNYKLKRVYYSAYSPIPDSSSVLPAKAPPLVREHRLYQADWLMRFYGFEYRELLSEKQPDLDLRLDPKTSWALQNLDQFPIDLNTAPRELLLRIPGVGVRNVENMLQIRRWQKLRLQDVLALRINLKRTLPFIITVDHRPHNIEKAVATLLEKETPPEQLDLFSTAARGG